MQLDKTRIVIRERGMFELLDLTLCVIRGHGGGLLACWFFGCAPFALLNLWLFRDQWHPATFSDGALHGYLWQSILLILWEIPLATAPMTLYLGQSLFFEQPTAGGIARALAQRWGQILVFPLLMRGVVLAWPTIAFIHHASSGVLVFLSLIAVLGLGCNFLFWPYFNEVLLLERNPLTVRRNEVTTLQRIFAIHGHATGDVFGRSIISLIVAVLLLDSLWRASEQLHQQVMLDDGIAPAISAGYSQLAMWFVAGFFTVVRFLSYLDLRIRTEGWEVELSLRAEGAKIARQVT